MALLTGAANITNAQSAQQTVSNTSREKGIADNAKGETNRVKYLNLSQKQQDDIYQINLDYAKKMYSVANPSAVDRVALDQLNVEKAAKYKKVLTKEQYAKWESNKNK